MCRISVFSVATFYAVAAAVGSEPDAGFYRVEQMRNEWVMLDAVGEPVYLRGLNHFGDGSYMPWNLVDRYGDARAWRRALPDRMREWGFNYLPPSIGPSAIDPDTLRKDATRLVARTKEWPAEHYAELDFPFTIFLEVPKQYMAGANMPDVFGAEFRNDVDARCREVCLPLRENPHLIGYHFCHNPPWNLAARSADQWIADCTRKGSAGRHAWVRLMRRIYGSVERWRETYGVPINDWHDIDSLDNPLGGYISKSRLQEDKEAFLQRICEKWHQVYAESIRRYDTNHLILGDRNTLHLQPAPQPWAFHIMRRYLDVLSVNVMGPPKTVYGVMETATRHWDGPILLADTGAGIYTGEPAKAGFQASDLAEWEAVYSGMMHMGVEHPQIIGFAWCGFYETPPPSNRSGIVDCRTDDPLPERLEIVIKWNAWMKENYPKPQRPFFPGE